MRTCVCGHSKKDHIYEEGACRPGFVCDRHCKKYIESNTGESVTVKRMCWMREYSKPEIGVDKNPAINYMSYRPPEPTGKWLGPYLFHEWGTCRGDSMAIVEDPVTGECHMVYPGQLKFEKENL